MVRLIVGWDDTWWGRFVVAFVVVVGLLCVLRGFVGCVDFCWIILRLDCVLGWGLTSDWVDC